MGGGELITTMIGMGMRRDGPLAPQGQLSEVVGCMWNLTGGDHPSGDVRGHWSLLLIFMLHNYGCPKKSTSLIEGEGGKDEGMEG